MRKILWILTILLLALSFNAFGQNKRKKKPLHNLPEVNDEVLVAFRKKQAKSKVSSRKKSTKRKTSILQFDEADAIFGKTNKHKTRKKRRKNK